MSFPRFRPFLTYGLSSKFKFLLVPVLLEVLSSQFFGLVTFCIAVFGHSGVCTLSVHFYQECAYCADFNLSDRASEGVIMSGNPGSVSFCS